MGKLMINIIITSVIQKSVEDRTNVGDGIIWEGDDDDGGYLNHGGSMNDVIKNVFCEEKPVKDTKMVENIGWVVK